MAERRIRQHQPLRVPSNWTGEARALVIQLESLLDDIYAKFGRIGIKDLDESLREEIGAEVPDMTGASASADGAHGLVPAPATGEQGKFLQGDATWATPENTTYEFDSGYDATTNKAATVATVTGKISDLNLGTASQKSVANNLTTASSGTAVLDAYQGKVLKDQLGQIQVVTAIMASSSTSVTLENYCSYLITAVSGATSHQGLWMVMGFATGSQVITVQAGSAISVSVSGLTVTFTHSSGRNTRYTVLKLAEFAS